MSQRIFKTNPVKRILIYLLVFVVVFVFTTSLLKGQGFDFFYWTINIITFAVCFLLIFFDKDTTIICDGVGCTVNRKKFWQHSGESFGFQWNEVSETEYFADADTSREFYVEIDGAKTKLLTGDFSLDDFDYFIETVNEVTPHLPYVWEKGSGWLSSTFENRRYDKVAR